MISAIDIAALFEPASTARDDADRAIMAAAEDIGFLTVSGLPREVPHGAAARRELLRIFGLPPQELRRLWRQKFDPSQPNVYRGWFPLQNGHATYKEGIDMGPDVAYGAAAVEPDDVLTERTPLPSEAALPGWRASAAAYYRSMERVAHALMRAVARGLGLPETIFDAIFEGGISTLRLIHYPPRPQQSFVGASPEEIWVEHEGERRYVTGRAHVDTGFVTMLEQDGVEGLQACGRDGRWADIPPAEGTLAVNFGNTFERWTGGRVRATAHRVLGTGRERYSIPFFFEPRVDARIAPLPLANVAPFDPYLYGDHLWAAATRFVEFQGLEGLRKPRGIVPIGQPKDESKAAVEY